MPAEILRRARARLGASLEQVSRDTRIAVEYLAALEDGTSLDAFPAPVYAKFFLREYARYLGLDEEALVATFTACVGPTGPTPVAVLPPKYEALGPDALRVANAVARGRVLPLARALLPRRRRSAPPPEEPGPIRLATNPPRARRSYAPALLSVALVAAGLLAASRMDRAGDTVATAGSAAGGAAGTAPAQLPRGGTTIFPHYRVVALYGAPNTERLGILGIGPDAAATRLLAQARAYRPFGRPVLPAFELIVTVAQAWAGDDGMYRARQSFLDIQRYLGAARRARALMILDVQPGRSDFMTEVKVLAPFLRQPDVGLALDPEWAVGEKGVPGQVLGSVDATTVNRVVDWLTAIVRKHRLPQKMLVLHQFTNDMIRDRHAIKSTPEVAVVFDVDGWGGRAVKRNKYQEFSTIEGFHGFKLFYKQDIDLMSPLDVHNLYPSPDLVIYQ